MAAQWLYNSWVLYPVSIAAIFSASEGARWLGRRIRARRGSESGRQAPALEGPLFGLLALMIGFTFAMSLAHYDLRKGDVLAEANAIGAAALRAEVLPAPHGARVRDLLRTYVELHLSVVAKVNDPAAFSAAVQESDRLQGELWQIALAVSAREPQSLPVGLFVESLNRVIDLDSARVEAVRNRVPAAIIVILYAISIGALAITGYDVGRSGRRERGHNVLMALSIAVLIALIIDLDLPQQGLIVVGQQPMIDLLASFDR